MSYKYSRTFHAPWSKGATDDDKILHNIDSLLGEPIIISEKIDGSNSCLEYSNCYARTHSGPPTHPSFDGFKALHSTVKYNIPENIQLFGEWVYALHSIAYSKLPSYFMLFNVRNIDNLIWTSWEEVELWAEEIKVPTVPVLYRGTVNSKEELKELTDKFMEEPSVCGEEREGVVIRLSREFKDDEFYKSIVKVVRENHVKSTSHWKFQKIIKNKLIGD